MISKEDLVRKLTSRKFWSLVAALVTSILVLMNFDEGTITQILAVVGAFGSIIAYIFAEAYVDGKREGNRSIIIVEDDPILVEEEDERLP